jgi:hypothetical protein
MSGARQGQLLAGEGVPAVEHGPQVRRLDPALQADGAGQ